jgi:hypothetical protein
VTDALRTSGQPRSALRGRQKIKGGRCTRLGKLEHLGARIHDQTRPYRSAHVDPVQILHRVKDRCTVVVAEELGLVVLFPTCRAPATDVQAKDSVQDRSFDSISRR